MKHIGFKHQRESKQNSDIDIIMCKDQRKNVQILDNNN